MIGPFVEEYFFLSNFYLGAPFTYKGIEYPTAEHAFQAAKTTNYADHRFVLNAVSPNEAKRRGRRVGLRSDWEYSKNKVMHDIVYAKFSQNPHLKKKLLETGEEELVEVNYWGDTYWGTNSKLEGLNKLGLSLMKVREELKNT